MSWIIQLTTVLSSLQIVLTSSEDLCADYPASLCNVTFSDPQNLRSHSDNVIHIGVSLKIINQNNNKEEEDDLDSGFKADIRNLFGSLLALSTGATQHWIILTDQRSVQSVNRVLRAAVTSHIAINLIRTYKGRRKIRRVPRIIFDFIDLESIATEAEDELFIKTVQSFMMNNLREKGLGKYKDKLFFTGPLYHRIFPNLNKLIFMDVDLDIQSNIKILYQQFAQFSQVNLLGVGHDLSPHYRLNLENYRRRHPASTLGDPGPTQGFNTGVVLYNLARMRESEEYNRLLSEEEVKRVMRKYGYTVSLGDQDWFTNIGYEAPHLFYRLPCQFNAQVSVQYWRPPWEEDFEKYHYCEKPFHIVHKNGCGPTRDVCDKVLKDAGMDLSVCPSIGQKFSFHSK